MVRKSDIQDLLKVFAVGDKITAEYKDGDEGKAPKDLYICGMIYAEVTNGGKDEDQADRALRKKKLELIMADLPEVVQAAIKEAQAVEAAEGKDA